MPDTIEAIRVDVTNLAEGQPEEVRSTLAGLAYITGALISVGEKGTVTSQYNDLDQLSEGINVGLANPEVSAALEQQHPTLEQIVAAVQESASSSAFHGFLGRLGVFGTAYLLEPSEEDPNHFSLTFVGFD